MKERLIKNFATSIIGGLLLAWVVYRFAKNFETIETADQWFKLVVYVFGIFIGLWLLRAKNTAIDRTAQAGVDMLLRWSGRKLNSEKPKQNES